MVETYIVMAEGYTRGRAIKVSGRVVKWSAFVLFSRNVLFSDGVCGQQTLGSGSIGVLSLRFSGSGNATDLVHGTFIQYNRMKRFYP